MLPAVKVSLGQGKSISHAHVQELPGKNANYRHQHEKPPPRQKIHGLFLNSRNPENFKMYNSLTCQW